MDPGALQVGAALRDAVPAWSHPVVLAITALGNVAVLLAVFTLDYWFGDHERGAHAIAILTAGMAMVVGLKALFGAPRPPPEVNAIPIAGFSFPSGHAAAATIGYGVLAFDHEVGPRGLRYAAAGLVIGMVALSRVVLGVHYLHDVVAGVLFGGAFLIVAIGLTGRVPRQGFVLALGLGAVALAVAGLSHDGVAVFGAALGAALTWELLDGVPEVEQPRGQAALLTVALPILLVVAYVSTRPWLPEPVVLGLNAALLAGVLVSPRLATA